MCLASCSLFVVCRLLLLKCWCSSVACCVLFVVFRVLFAVWCLLFVDVLLWFVCFNLLMYMFVGVSLVVCCV